MKTNDVAKIKALGRKVKNYSDTIWGIGLSMHDSKRFDIHEWKGTNLLGFALMSVRNTLAHKNEIL